MTIQLSDKQARLLEAKAAAAGLSVEGWIQKLAEAGDDTSISAGRTGADLIAALQACPHPDFDIEPERYRLPVRDVTL